MIQTDDYEIVGSYNNQIISSIDAERSLNAFEYHDMRGKKPKALVNTSGLINTNLVFGSQTGGFRAQFVFNNNEYSIIGNQIFLTTPGNSVSLLGTISNGTGYAAIEANTFQVIFVNGQNGYIWDTTAQTFNLITDTSFPTEPIDVTSLDGFFVVANGGTNNFQLSSFNQGMVWGPAENFYTASAVTNLFTILGSSLPGGATGTDNYRTGVPVVLVAPLTGVNFTTNIGAENHTLNITSPGTSANYPTGAPIKFSGTGTLPTPIVAGTKYYAINTGASTIEVATTYGNAISNMPIVLTANAVAPVTFTGQIPDGFNIGQTYYTIFISSSTIKLASTYANAIAGMGIIPLSNAGADNQILSLGQLQEGSITTHPGNIVACRTLHRRLFLFSAFFTEVWENSGLGSNLPFRRNNSLLIEYGTPAVGSISVSFDTMVFLSQSRDGLGSVMQTDGTQAAPISTSALDAQLATYGKLNQVSDCRGFLIKENNIIFYRMNFTTAAHTFVYNLTMSDPSQDDTKLWHEEEPLNGGRHVAQTHAYFNGNNYVGHYAKPILYILDSHTYTNDGEAIRRMRITKAVVPPGYQRLRIDRLQVDLLQGNIRGLDSQFEELNLLTENNDPILTENGSNIILETEQLVSNPENLFMFLSISKDGGQTYDYTARAPMGNIGQRTFRTLWRKLGVIPRGQAFVCKFEFFQAVPFIILGASWAKEVLPE